MYPMKRDCKGWLKLSLHNIKRQNIQIAAWWHHRFAASHGVDGHAARTSHWGWIIHEAVLTRWPDWWHPDVLPVSSHFLALIFVAWGKCVSPPHSYVQYLMKSYGAFLTFFFWRHVVFESLLPCFLLNSCPSWRLSVSVLCCNAAFIHTVSAPCQVKPAEISCYLLAGYASSCTVCCRIHLLVEFSWCRRRPWSLQPALVSASLLLEVQVEDCELVAYQTNCGAISEYQTLVFPLWFKKEKKSFTHVSHNEILCCAVGQH